MDPAKKSAASDWRHRYETLLSQQEKQQARYRRKSSLLTDAILSLVQFGRELDAAADEKLLAMKGLIRQDSVSNVDLARVVEALDTQLEQSLEERERHQKVVSKQMRALARHAEGLTQQRELKAELSLLKKQLANQTLHYGDIAKHLATLAKLQGLAIKQSRQGQSLIERWFGRTAEAEAEGDGETVVPLDSVSSYLQQLLDEIEPVDAMRGTFDVATNLVGSGLTNENLDIAIQSVTDVVLASMSTDKQEMTGYLNEMNARLEEVTRGLSTSHSLLQEEIHMNRGFGDALETSMQTLRDEIEVQPDINSLKLCINNNLDKMMSALNDHRQQEDSVQSQLSDQLELLVKRARELESQGKEAERQAMEQRERALTDNLTGIPNREAYEERAKSEVDRWRRYERPLCLAVCDIDWFKTVNDSAGHAAGDEVLRQVALMIRQRLRGSDFVARYGGEEFVVLLPETDREQAFTVMDDLRQAIEQTPVAWEKRQINLTISIGIADFKGKDILQSVFTRADRALYQAKTNGRNRVELALD